MPTSGADETPRFLRVGEVAKALNTSKATVYRRVHEGSLPALRLGDGTASLRIDAEELDRWLHRSESSRSEAMATATRGDGLPPFRPVSPVAPQEVLLD